MVTVGITRRLHNTLLLLSSSFWCGAAAVAVVVIDMSWFHLLYASCRCRLRYVGVDPLPSSLSHLGICHGRFDVNVFVVLTWTCCCRCCCHRLRDVGVDPLLSSLSRLGICHRRLNVVVFVDLAWTRCRVGHGG